MGIIVLWGSEFGRLGGSFMLCAGNVAFRARLDRRNTHLEQPRRMSSDVHAIGSTKREGQERTEDRQRTETSRSKQIACKGFERRDVGSNSNGCGGAFN